uniref:Uncharacterized protein n=1 Tax=Micrurus lemniscatus lemniscatus TaxID=129467 RepID=A0A2D4IPY4_MICLE
MQDDIRLYSEQDGSKNNGIDSITADLLTLELLGTWMSTSRKQGRWAAKPAKGHQTFASTSSANHIPLRQGCQTDVVTAVSHDVSWLPPPFAKPGMGVASA